jgi:hypothetical protein
VKKALSLKAQYSLKLLYPSYWANVANMAKNPITIWLVNPDTEEGKK